MKTQIKEVVTSKDGILFSKVIEEVPTKTVYKDVKKGKARAEIQEQVFDLADSVADNAKMISLMMSVIKRIYNALPSTTKSKIEDREMIESMIALFDSIQTAADVKFQAEGDKMIKRLFERQNKVGEVIKKIYNIGDK